MQAQRSAGARKAAITVDGHAVQILRIVHQSLALWLEEIKNGGGDFFRPLRHHGVASAIDFLQRYAIAELVLDQAPVFWGSNHVLKTLYELCGHQNAKRRRG